MNGEPIPRLSATLHPSLSVGEGALAQAAYLGADFELLAQRLFAHFKENPDDMGLLLDLSVVLQFAHHREEGLVAQAEALARQQIYRVCGSQGPPAEPCLRVLALMAPGDLMTNTPLEFIFEHIPIRLDLLFLLPGTPLPAEIPDHDVAFVAVSHSDDRIATLMRIQELITRWPRPVLQSPSRLLNTSREGVAASLAGIPGTVIPPIRRVTRELLADWARAGHAGPPQQGAGELRTVGFPALLRPIESHAGKNLEKLDGAGGVLDYLERTDEAEFYLTPFVDYAGPDGMFRKYRIVLIEGRPYLCHMALSDHWMIHYANAGMVTSAEKRAEEARAMAEFDTDFALRHGSALSLIGERVGLDYLGIDCAETPDGRLLVFEADAAMVVHAMDPPEIFPYKRAEIEKVFQAFYAMIAHVIDERTKTR